MKNGVFWGCCAVWLADVSEERIASIFRVEINRTKNVGSHTDYKALHPEDGNTRNYHCENMNPVRI
jgi:hypothetical protein